MSSLPPHATGEEPSTRTPVQAPPPSEGEQHQAAQAPRVSLAPIAPEHHIPSLQSGLGDHGLTIAHAIDSYLQAHRDAGHGPKTLEWHRTALHQLQLYLLAEPHLLQISQLTDTIMHDWVAFLQQTPPPGNKPLAASSIETYARSVRAFCTWLVQQGALSVSPMRAASFPRASLPLPHLVSPAAFGQFMQARVPPEAPGSHVRLLAARDRAILWVLFDTGITVSEIWALRVEDLGQETGMRHVRGEGGKARQIALGPTCLDHLLSSLEQCAGTAKVRSSALKAACR